MLRGSTPDANALFGRQVERVAFLDVERLVPRIEVAHRQRPVHARRVAVGRNLLAQRRVARLRRPGLGISNEETLVAREAVDYRRLLAAQRRAIGVIGRLQPARKSTRLSSS